MAVTSHAHASLEGWGGALTSSLASCSRGKSKVGVPYLAPFIPKAGPALANVQDKPVWEAQPKRESSLELKLFPLPALAQNVSPFPFPGK